MTLIGIRELENLVLGMEVVERFSHLPGQKYSIHDFWAGSLRCALLSREFDSRLAKNTRIRLSFADCCTISGNC